MDASGNISYEWTPIDDLPEDHEPLESSDLRQLSRLWKEQKDEIEKLDKVQELNERLLRRWAVETGIIERLYVLDEGVTKLLVERGLDVDLIQHKSTEKDPEQVMSLIKDQHSVAEGLFRFIKNERSLTKSYIKELHAALTQHQDKVEAVNQFGEKVERDLRRGEFKKYSNNPTTDDGVHEYCPPEHVDSEMDRLLEMHRDHVQKGVAPEVEAAWLHHRFTQIHPFQDGNGRVARSLATLIYLKAGWLPLVVTNAERADYISALREADKGDLQPLVNLFSKLANRSFVQALSAAENVRDYGRSLKSAIVSIKDTFEKRREQLEEDWEQSKKISHRLRDDAISFFQDVQKEIERDIEPEVPASKNMEVFVDGNNYGENRDHWFKKQIVEVANNLDYYANISMHHDWARLCIQMEGRSVVLVSIHGIGREFRGLLVATACFYEKDYSADADPITNIAPLVDQTFSINYREDEANIRRRFQNWIEEVVINGLESFRRSL
jgi:Fic family protein